MWAEYLDLAKRIAQDAHKGQLRKDGVTPYITHPEHIAKQFEKQHPRLQIISWLHDVVEDNPKEYPLSKLRELIPLDDVIDAVDALTHREGEPYSDYIVRLMGNFAAKQVKIEDLKHNLSTSNGIKSLSPNKIEMWKMALWMLSHSCYEQLYNSR